LLHNPELRLKALRGSDRCVNRRNARETDKGTLNGGYTVRTPDITKTGETNVQAQIDSTTTALSLAKMQERYEACKEGADAPNLITTDETEFNAFWGLLQPQQRFSDGDTAKAGFRNLMFNGAVNELRPTSEGIH